MVPFLTSLPSPSLTGPRVPGRADAQRSSAPAVAVPRARCASAAHETSLVMSRTLFQDHPEHVLPPSQGLREGLQLPPERFRLISSIGFGWLMLSCSQQSFPSPSHTAYINPLLGVSVASGSLQLQVCFSPPQGAFSKSLTSRRKMIIRLIQTCKTHN